MDLCAHARLKALNNMEDFSDFSGHGYGGGGGGGYGRKYVSLVPFISFDFFFLKDFELSDELCRRLKHAEIKCSEMSLFI